MKQCQNNHNLTYSTIQFIAKLITEIEPKNTFIDTTSLDQTVATASKNIITMSDGKTVNTSKKTKYQTHNKGLDVTNITVPMNVTDDTVPPPPLNQGQSLEIVTVTN